MTNSSSSAFSTLSIGGLAQAVYREGRQAMREQRYQDAIDYFTHALQIPGASDTFRARVFEFRGVCYWLLKSFDAAEEDYQAAFEATNEPMQKARAKVGLGNVADSRGQFQLAIAYYEEALAEGIAADETSIIGQAQRGLGIVNRRQGQTEAALNHLNMALNAFRKIGAAREQGRVLVSLGRTRQARGEYQLALTAQKEALTIFESLGDRWRVVQVLNDLGETHQSLYDLGQAIAYHQQALKMADSYNARLIKPEIQRNLGVDLVEQGQLEAGLVYLRKALEGAREIGYREQEALTLYSLSQAFLRLNHIAAALQAATQLNQIAEELDADRYRALAAFGRGALLFQEGKVQEAITELNGAALAAQTSVDRGVLWQIHATIGHMVDNPDLAQVHLNIAAEYIRHTVEPLKDPTLKERFVYAPPVLAVLQAMGIDPDKL